MTIAISIELAFPKEKEYRMKNFLLNPSLKTIKDNSVQKQICHHKYGATNLYLLNETEIRC
jgi:hypothetical protein